MNEQLDSLVEELKKYGDAGRACALDSEDVLLIVAALSAQPRQDGKKATAWAEGYKAGISDEQTSAANVGIAGLGGKVGPARENPYGKAQPASAPVGVEAIRWMVEVMPPKPMPGDDYGFQMSPNHLRLLHERFAALAHNSNTSESVQAQPAAIPRLANCGKYTATDNTGQHYYLNHANTWQTFQGQQPAAVDEAKAYPLWQAIHAAAVKAGHPCNVGLAQVVDALAAIAQPRASLNEASEALLLKGEG